MSKSSHFMEYMKLHLISLNQDMENALQGEGYDYLNGQIQATEHLMSVASDMILS